MINNIFNNADNTYNMTRTVGFARNTSVDSYITCSRISTDLKTVNNNGFDMLDVSHDVSDINRQNVTVQHLTPHTELRNDCWSKFCNFYNNSNATSACLMNASEQNGDCETRNVNNVIYDNNNDNYSVNNNNNNDEVKSAFNIEKSSSEIFPQTHKQPNNNLQNHDMQTIIDLKNTTVPRIQRNEDQEYAYRRIESVHNYAKLSAQVNGDGCAEDDDESDDDEDDVDEDGDDEYDDEADIDYENFFNKRKQNVQQSSKNVRRIRDDEDIDVETIESSATSNDITNTRMLKLQPDHHARRPMNAFLIFCKRHRTIVKERYKNLENRAITKILGDWWASLDADNKKCFVELAQENKDAFFSANPNFKWYKLPAPSMRTTNGNPMSVGKGVVNHQAANNTISNDAENPSNYFKLADEAQMGDLSALIVNNSEGSTNSALQKALGETSKFLNIHMPDAGTATRESTVKHLKRNAISNEHDSEGDNLVPKKKSARTCKGKIYQELINSGQIAPLVKKTKSSARLADMQMLNEHSSRTNNQMLYAKTELDSNDSSCRSGEQQMLHDVGEFDLDERIKELPALSLDDYLQKKHNTKKKKKLSAGGYKRKTNRNIQNDSNKIMPPASMTGFLIKAKDRKSIANANAVQQAEMQQQMQQQHQQQAASAVVGSKKRKARKESITRRDISSIENEVLTINDCGFVQPTAVMSPTLLQSCDIDSEISMRHSPAIQSAPAAMPQLFNSTIMNEMSSTSDLLILAEVASNRFSIFIIKLYNTPGITSSMEDIEEMLS